MKDEEGNEKREEEEYENASVFAYNQGTFWGGMLEKLILVSDSQSTAPGFQPHPTPQKV